METFRVIIAGSRNYEDFYSLSSFCKICLSKKSNIEIVSGHAKGADLLGERFSKENGYRLKLFPAEWDKYGLAAGPKRNKAMAAYADALIAFWDGSSKGTKNMIELAKRNNLEVRIKKIPRKTG